MRNKTTIQWILVIGLAFTPIGVVAQTATSLRQDIALANSGNTAAQIRVGRSYLFGFHGNYNPATAKSWFQKAADQGSSEAQSWLGYLLMSKNAGDPINLDAARNIFQTTSDRKDTLGMAFLGMLYENGAGAEKDINKAKGLYEEAVALGGGRAAELLGSLYWSGILGKPDIGKAIQLYNLSASRGDDWGELRLGDAYSKGLGVQKDLEKAKTLYLASARQGNKVAEVRLADLARQSPDELRVALIDYLRAARQGYAPGEAGLAEMTWNGLGIPEDKARGYAWLSIAAKQGERRYALELQEWSKQMNENDLQQVNILLDNPSYFMSYYKTH